MEMTDNPYEYGDEQMDGGLEGRTPEGCENGGDAVIVDGESVSYRSYQARNGG
jgi:hypothetical protein